MDISQRSHDLINRLERKFAMKLATSTNQHNQTPVHDNEFNFPRIRRHVPVVYRNSRSMKTH